MANKIATAIKYATEALDTIMATESKATFLEGGRKFINFDFKKAGKVEIMSMLMDGLSDYYRANSTTADSGRTNYNAAGVHGDGYKVGNVKVSWEEYALRFDRAKQFQIDEMDNEETAGNTVALSLSEFYRLQVVPERDAVVFSTIAENSYTSLGNRVTETPVVTEGNASEITQCFNRGIAWLEEHEVPSEDQIIFVSPTIEAVIKNSGAIKKYISQEDVRSPRGITFKVSAYEGKPIINVPSSRFLTKIVTTDNGYVPATGAKILNYEIVSKRAVVPVVKLDKAKIFNPDAVQDFDGYKINVRIYHDCLIPKNKIVGCYVSISADDATTKSSLLSVALEKTSVADTYKLVAHFTSPAGKLGTVIWSDTALALGATATSDQLKNVATDGENFKVKASNTKEFFGLVDGSGKIIAISGEVTLPTA